MEQRLLEPGPLLDRKGELLQSGYALKPVLDYERKLAKGFLKIKEWDYYLIYNERFALALTLADNSYMGMVSVSFIDFEHLQQHTNSHISLLPLGGIHMPASSEQGDVVFRGKKSFVAFRNNGRERRLSVSMEDFHDHQPIYITCHLFDEPRDSMVIATPFADKPTQFYYNRKIVGISAEGSVEVNGKTYTFESDDTRAILDWGRGVWPFENTWYWSAAASTSGGHDIGFNLGYGFGNNTSATENMIFVDGIAHKLGEVTFKIPGKRHAPSFMEPWVMRDKDARLELTFVPMLDRSALMKILMLLSDQHQVFGRFSGWFILDDGTRVDISNMVGFAEKVHNRW